MNAIAGCSAADIERFCQTVSPAVRAAASFETAAQTFTNALVRQFETIALARVFGTVECERLPVQERRFAARVTPDVALFPTTEVLTLFGTAGALPDWNDRHRSQGHLALPLLSRRSIGEAPMLSKLLNDLHFSFNTETLASRPLATRAFANANALCHIADAATTIDVLGRPIIPASDFVRAHHIRSVLGIGGSYIVARMFIAIVLFTTETVPLESATHLLALSSAFKAATTAIVRRQTLFDPQEGSRTVVQ